MLPLLADPVEVLIMTVFARCSQKGVNTPDKFSEVLNGEFHEINTLDLWKNIKF